MLLTEVKGQRENMSGKELEFSDLPTLLAILTTLCTIAVIMNIVVIVVFCLRRKMSIDAFIVNMAIADVLLAGIALPLRFFDVIKSAADFNQGRFRFFASAWNDGMW